MSFVPLKGFTNETLNKYQFTIKRKSNHFIINEGNLNIGYIRVCLNGTYYMKLVLIARQFLTDDDLVHKNEVSQKNQNRSDYHLNNLRWLNQDKALISNLVSK